MFTPYDRDDCHMHIGHRYTSYIWAISHGKSRPLTTLHGRNGCHTDSNDTSTLTDHIT